MQVCWALVNDELLMLNEELVVYPNPSSAIFYIKNADGKKKELYSVLGELLFSTKADEMDVRNITKGMYYLRVENQIKKIIVE
ncbi:MAG: T9SS type A sorting domain-containing protein [Bacteroidetes bacterium]|nr:T9SS type A sorting domain-containing protein [Bacteroidota bacterium]